MVGWLAAIRTDAYHCYFVLLGQGVWSAVPVSEIELDNRSSGSVDVSEITLVRTPLSHTYNHNYLHTYIKIDNR